MVDWVLSALWRMSGHHAPL